MAKKDKNKIEVKVIQGNNVSKSTVLDMDEYAAKVKEGATPEKTPRVGWLISRLDYPVIVSYGKNDIRVSPRSVLKVGDVEKVGKLPKGVYTKKIAKVVTESTEELI